VDGKEQPFLHRRKDNLLGGNLNALMKQAKAMQEQMTKLKKELETLRIEASVGGGMVTVVCNGSGDVVSIKIDPALVQEKDVEMLETMILSAVNEGRRRAEEAARQAMKKITGGLPLSGLANLIGESLKQE